jgi:hypothetical protein
MKQMVKHATTINKKSFTTSTCNHQRWAITISLTTNIVIVDALRMLRILLQDFSY